MLVRNWGPYYTAVVGYRHTINITAKTHLIHVRNITCRPVSQHLAVPHPDKKVLLHSCNRVTTNANLSRVQVKVRMDAEDHIIHVID